VEGIGCGLILRYYSDICLKGLRKTTKHLNQDIRFSGLDLNPDRPNMIEDFSPLKNNVLAYVGIQISNTIISLIILSYYYHCHHHHHHLNTYSQLEAPGMELVLYFIPLKQHIN
jgi:hypothetical protein